MKTKPDLRHEAQAVELAPGTWRPLCACGFKSKNYERTEAIALKVAEQHIASKQAAARRCTKVQFAEADAERVLVEAKLARTLRGKQKRREQSKYPCTKCGPGIWHLSTMGDPR